jgi:hypothetical protein
LGPFFYLIYNSLIWGSAAIVVGTGYLIWEILKLFCKLLEKLFDKIDTEEYSSNNKRVVRENRRVV